MSRENIDIFIDKDGNWFCNGEKVKNRKIYLYFMKILKKDENGYFLDDGTTKVYVKVEDTPFVVRSVEKREGFLLTLNDETVEKLDLKTLTFKGNIVYCKVKGGERARFSRPAYYQLAKYIEEEDGKFFIEEGGMRYWVR